MMKLDIISDNSHRDLKEVPEVVLSMCNLKMLYLESNQIESLPGDFFPSLPKLTWLDLRNNKLKSIPENVAYHAFLENLLVSNNALEVLPNELGLVPNLKVLLISGNPLVYPSQCVIEKGVSAICGYLKEEYEKFKPVREEDEEKEIMTVEPSSNETSPVSSHTITTKRNKKYTVQEILRNACKTVLRKHRGEDDLPVINVKSLQRPKEEKEPDKKSSTSLEPGRKMHRMTKSCSKVSLYSHCSTNKYIGARKTRNVNERTRDADIKEVWLMKLKDLLLDQEKILQQEKNLKALNKWRFEKKTEPPRNTSLGNIPECPYDTNPEYNKLMSRQDLTKEIDRMIKHNKKASKKADVQKLISEVISQLKVLENGSEEQRTPRSEMENAMKEIQSIIELHSKISTIRTNVNSY